VLLTAFLLVFAAPAGDALPPIGTIDFYGLRTISEGKARRPLALKEGESLPLDDESVRRTLTEARQRLVGSLGVAEARIEMVCCEAGKLILYVGIDEKGASAAHWSAEPQGTERLPEETLRTGAAFGDALMLAVEKGDAAEDDTAGHSLSHNPALRSIERRFIAFAADNVPLLRDVLHHSADAAHRALAAQILAYAPDKRAIVDDLVEAAQDPAPDVRNNATRALAVMAGAGFPIPAPPFIPRLNSIEWTDRNKASGLLAELTKARDPAVLSRLCEEALPALTEMARWKSAGHACASFFILGRMAGLPEKDIESAWTEGRREEVIAKASRCAPSPTPSR
jgi:hypothetical protein